MLRRCTAWSFAILISGAVVLFGTAAVASPLGAGLRLRADPDRVPADGETPVAISVEVVDALGRPAPEGTAVHFVTTLGEIISPAETLGGIAQTVLKPSNTAGTALVSAVVGASQATIEVEFFATAGSAAPGSRMVELTADELSYSAERRVFLATWNAELKYQTMEIRADGIQYDMTPNVVRAQGNVTLRSGGRLLQADALRYELRALRGRLLRVSEEIERLVVEGDGLQTRPDPSEDPCLWRPLPTDGTRTWVKAQRAIIDPRHKVILDHATFYMDDTRVMSLRRHVIDPRFGGALFGNSFGYTSGAGVDMDFPVYYRASGHRVGSLHITRNRTVGGNQYDPGWSLGLKEEYLQENDSGGAFTLQDVLHPDRGLTWEHRHQLGGGARLSLSASAVTFEDDGPRLRSKGISYFRPVSGGRLSLALSGSDFGGSESYFGDLAYRPRTRRLGSGVLMTPVLHLRHSRHVSDHEEFFVDPTTGEALQIARAGAGRTTSPGLDFSFDLPDRDLGNSTRMTARLMTGYAWGVRGGARGVVDGQLGITRRLGPTQYLRLSYSYASRPAGLQPYLFTSGRQRLSLRGSTIVKGCRMQFNASQELDGERAFGSLHLARPLPFGSDAVGRPLWSLKMSHFFSRLEAYRISSTRLSLTRLIGRYRASLCYSPQGRGLYDNRPWISAYGYGYTYSGGRTLWLEFSAATQ